MFEPIVIALAALGLSVGVTSVKLISWFLRSDPKAMAQPAGWVTFCLTAAAVMLLVVLLFKGQWSASIELAAAMLLTGTFFGPRMVQQWRKLFRRNNGFGPGLDTSRPLAGQPGDNSPPPDPELVRQSIAVLEDYLHKSLAAPTEDQASGQAARNRPERNAQGNGMHEAPAPMSEPEALEILGLKSGCQAWEIDEAHRRMVRKVHPDQGGSNYLTVKVNQARETLLNAADMRAEPHGQARKTARRRPTQRPN